MARQHAPRWLIDPLGFTPFFDPCREAAPRKRKRGGKRGSVTTLAVGEESTVGVPPVRTEAIGEEGVGSVPTSTIARGEDPAL